MAKDYWVYHNWTVEKGGRATIHHKRCSFCNNGRGLHSHWADNKTGKWIGPTNSPLMTAMRTKASNVKECHFCIEPSTRLIVT
jgi:hypothetical protein